jgi:hypothetical protein
MKLEGWVPGLRLAREDTGEESALVSSRQAAGLWLAGVGAGAG